MRLKAGLSERQRTHTIALIRQVVAMKEWQLKHGETYLVTGEPVLVADLTGSITHSIELLLVAVLLVMAGTLGLIFRGRPRLLPLGSRPARRRAHLRRAVARGRVADGRRDRGAAGARRSRGGLRDPVPVARGGGVSEGVEDARVAVGRAAMVGAPTIATAGIASVGAMLVLLLSPVPMVRGFGLLLVVGVVIAFICALTAGSAALVLADRRSAGAGDAR